MKMSVTILITFIVLMVLLIPLVIAAEEQQIVIEEMSENSLNLLGETRKAGDINGDGKVDSIDILTMKRHILSGRKTSWKLTGDAFKYADINGDGKVDLLDLLQLKRIILKTDKTDKIDKTEKINVGRIDLEKSIYNMQIGESIIINVSISPNNATDKTLKWTSSNEKIAIVNNGKVTAKEAGETIIRVESTNGRKAECKVTVSQIEVTAVKLNKTSHTMKNGESILLTAEVSPANSADKTIRWTSSNEKVATVNSGKVIAKEPGETIIKAESTNGKKAECRITVSKIEVTGVKLNKTNHTMKNGESILLTAEVSPTNSTDKTIKWTSSNEKVATVNSGRVTAKEPGEAIIKAESTNGKKAECKVIVSVPVVQPVAVTEVKLDKISHTMKKGESILLTAQVLPQNSTDKTIKWTSSNGNVATVNNAKVTAVGAGEAVIKAESTNGKKAECKITVTMAGQMEVHFLNLGRVDGILITCDGEALFIDSGFRSDGLAAVKYMKNLGITKLKYYIGTHAHINHVGGGSPIIAAFDPDIVYMPHNKVKDAILAEAVTTAEKNAAKKAKYKIMKKGNVITLGSASIECLGPSKILDVARGATSENSNSLILKVTYGDVSVLTTGDSTASIINSIGSDKLKANILKNPHHNGSVSSSLIKKISPTHVVFQTGDGYLPSSSYLTTLKGLGAKTYITSAKKDRTVKFTTDGKTITVKTGI